MTETNFPTTRYQGSKRSLSNWIIDEISEIPSVESVLDLFGGTGAIAYRLKEEGKEVYYNDYLDFNYHVGRAIIENDRVRLDDETIDWLVTPHSSVEYGSVIQDEFEGIYYTDDENEWLDMFRGNLNEVNNKYEKSIAIASMGQAALAKRPYNLFHRANLDMRKRDVDRSFGNKTTWEKSFEDHFRESVDEFNNAVFSNGENNMAYNEDALEWENPPDVDLVYMDPPYYDKNSGATNYQFYYHFLEGFLNYENWVEKIDYSVKTNKIEHTPSPWTRKRQVKDAFSKVFQKFSDSAIVLSYNTSGYPSPETLRDMLLKKKDNVRISSKDHQYVLSEKEDSPDEILIVAY